MLIHPAELTHASEKFELTTKECGAVQEMRSWEGLRGGCHFVGCAAVANQLAAAWMWLAGAILVEYGSLILASMLYYFAKPMI